MNIARFFPKKSKHLVLVLFLTFAILLVPSSPLLEIAIAETQKPAVANNVQLSDRVAKAIIADLSQQTGISPAKLKITQYSRQTWSNGCLGIAQAEEICTQALVEGWRVVVSGNSRTWVYRSDRNGRIVRLEPQKK
jgi:hypothetical protein